MLLSILAVSCSSISVYEKLYGPSSPKERVLTLEKIQQEAYISFSEEVQPILDKRCVVCHSCNDAPCQLNLASFEGLERGSTTTPVYNGVRYFKQDPTRLGIDAHTTKEWRKKGFTPVLNERRQDEQTNLDNSLLYQMLVMKKHDSFPKEGRLPETYNVGTDLSLEETFIHKQTCPTMETMIEFEINHPQWGMPFALPGLNHKEFQIIETWIKQGSYIAPAKQLPPAITSEISKWESFLNKPSNKEKLMSRYLYEHLFIGHLYFDAISKSDFFMLVRSRTPPGEEIDIIASVRPYDNPGVEKFYYRLNYYDRSIVNKTHMPYALNDNRMNRFKSLFLDPDYDVNQLPSYETTIAANPFKTFVAIPAISRYKFMLDETMFFISGFIKGPVCRGSVALSVIDDHFWVLFMDPDKSYVSQDSEFLANVSNELRIPTEKENQATILSVWSTYKDAEKKYFTEKTKYMQEHYPDQDRIVNMEHIWNGNRSNTNAALTIYRHNDSASVLKGFVGEIPKTGWVIDYPIFERIHYLLVAGFNVYGILGHQLSTRLYMDFLRIESETQFLKFFPSGKALNLHQYWYRGQKTVKKFIKFANKIGIELREPKYEYETNEHKVEFFKKVNQHLGDAQYYKDNINLCNAFEIGCKTRNLDKLSSSIQDALRKLSGLKGEITDVFPNVTFLRIKVDGTVENDLVYSIIRNKAYLNIFSLVPDENKHIKSEDTIDIVEGLVGAYPNFFLEVDYLELNNFVTQYSIIDSFEKYESLVRQYGIRRTNPNFWKSADWFYEKNKHENPVHAGLFDLARYKNR